MIRLVSFFSILAFLNSCHDSASFENKEIPVKGGKTYGSFFRFAIPFKPESLFPYSVVSLSDQQISSLIYEPLFERTESGSIKPLIASSYCFLESPYRLRVSLRDNVFFSNCQTLNHENTKVTARDVAFSLAFGCSSHPKNQYAYLLKGKILGGDDFYNNADTSKIKLSQFTGAQIINDTTIDVFLTNKSEQILNVLSLPFISILSYEAYLKYGSSFFDKNIGTGPFLCPQNINNYIEVKRNPNYYGVDDLGNPLPFLSGVRVFYNIDPVSSFENQDIDLIQNLSSNEINLLFGELNYGAEKNKILHRTYSLKDNELCFLVFNQHNPLIKSIENRKQLSEMFNRYDICEKTLGSSVRCQNSFINSEYALPSHFSSLDFSFDSIYVGFLSASTNTDSLVNVEIINQVCKNSNMIGLSKDIPISSVFKEPLGESIGLLKFNWVLDYPDPDSFLSLFYSRSEFAKYVGINDSIYDSLYERTILSKNLISEQKKAETYLLENYHFVPLYTNDMVFLENISMRDFSLTSAGLLNLKTVFKKAVPQITN